MSPLGIPPKPKGKTARRCKYCRRSLYTIHAAADIWNPEPVLKKSIDAVLCPRCDLIPAPPTSDPALS